MSFAQSYWLKNVSWLAAVDLCLLFEIVCWFCCVTIAIVTKWRDLTGLRSVRQFAANLSKTSVDFDKTFTKFWSCRTSKNTRIEVSRNHCQYFPKRLMVLFRVFNEHCLSFELFSLQFVYCRQIGRPSPDAYELLKFPFSFVSSFLELHRLVPTECALTWSSVAWPFWQISWKFGWIPWDLQCIK